MSITVEVGLLSVKRGSRLGRGGGTNFEAQGFSYQIKGLLGYLRFRV